MPSNQTEPAPAASQTDPLDTYRESVEESIVIIEGLAEYCSTPAEMVEMLKLGLKNDAQLTLIINKVSPVRFRK